MPRRGSAGEAGMPLKAYGVLTATAVARVREGAADTSPHYQIHLRDDAGVDQLVEQRPQQE